MKKSILNLGKALNKVEQKSIFGGTDSFSGGGGPGGGGNDNSDLWGFCYTERFGGSWIKTHCNDLCLNGTQPICPNP